MKKENLSICENCGHEVWKEGEKLVTGDKVAPSKKEREVMPTTQEREEIVKIFEDEWNKAWEKSSTDMKPLLMDIRLRHYDALNDFRSLLRERVGSKKGKYDGIADHKEGIAMAEAYDEAISDILTLLNEKQ